MESPEKILEVLMFTVNEKATEASKARHNAKDAIKEEFARGQWKAFCEVYTMLSNMNDNLKKS